MPNVSSQQRDGNTHRTPTESGETSDERLRAATRATTAATNYGHYEAGEQHEALDQLHQVNASEPDYHTQFGVYEQDHASAENTSFDQGHHVEYSDPSGEHYEESDYTSYDHCAAETDHVFAAEGSESVAAAEFHELDALQPRARRRVRLGHRDQHRWRRRRARRHLN